MKVKVSHFNTSINITHVLLLIYINSNVNIILRDKLWLLQLDFI
jgi:hypothetical protein